MTISKIVAKISDVFQKSFWHIFIPVGPHPDASKWKPALLEFIDAEQLPVRYGGSRTGAAGDDGCADEITYVEKLNHEVKKYKRFFRDRKFKIQST